MTNKAICHRCHSRRYLSLNLPVKNLSLFIGEKVPLKGVNPGDPLLCEDCGAGADWIVELPDDPGTMLADYVPGALSNALANGLAPENQDYGKNPRLLYNINRDLGRTIAGEETNRLLIYNVGYSARSATPLSLLLMGSSAAGKNKIVDTALGPFENVETVTRITDHALDRLEEGLDGKIVYIKEIGGMYGAQADIKLSISEKNLTLWSPEPNQKGRIMTQKRVIPAHCSYITTTSYFSVDPELENRVFKAYVDESSEQTARVHEFQGREFYDPGLMEQRGPHGDGYKPDSGLAGFTNNGIGPLYQVVSPYAAEIARVFPKKPVEMRRALPKLLNLAEVITRVHYQQRSIVSRGTMSYLLGDPVDYQLAYRIGWNSLLTSITGTTDPRLLSFWAQLPEWDQSTIEKSEFTTANIAKAAGINQDTARYKLKALLEKGLVVEHRDGKAFHWEKLTTPRTEISLLPDLTEWQIDGSQCKRYLAEYGFKVSRLARPASYYDPITGDSTPLTQDSVSAVVGLSGKVSPEQPAEPQKSPISMVIGDFCHSNRQSEYQTELRLMTAETEDRGPSHDTQADGEELAIVKRAVQEECDRIGYAHIAKVRYRVQDRIPDPDRVTRLLAVMGKNGELLPWGADCFRLNHS